MNILIYGISDFSYLIASQLHHQHNITVLSEIRGLDEKFNNLDISTAECGCGNITNFKKNDAAKADLFIACSDQDEANIISCWTVKKINDVETLCFIKKPELYEKFSSSPGKQYQTPYDIDSIFWPEQLLTQDIFRIVSVPDALDVEFLAEGKAKLFEYKITASSAIANTEIMKCDFPKDVLIAGISRDDKLFIPNGRTVIQPNDKAFFIGTVAALDTLAADFSRDNNKVSTVSIIGGGSVGYMLADMLEQRNIAVKIIESDSERCDYLANHLKKTLVLHGDGTDLEILETESIAAADVCVCITNNDERNLLCSLLIKQLGSNRIVTRVSNQQNYNLFTKVGIDIIVSPKVSALTEVLNRVQKYNVGIVALIEGGKGEVLRLTVPESFKLTKIKDIKFDTNAIVGLIIRRRRVLIPTGNTDICPGDQLKIFTMQEQSENITNLFFS